MDYLKNFFQKLKDNKLPIAAGGVLALAFTMLDIKLKPETKEKVAEVKKIVKEKMFPKKKIEVNPGKPVKEDFTESEYTGITAYVDGKPYRIIISKKDLDKVLGLQDDDKNTIEFYDEESPVELDNATLGEHWILTHCNYLENDRDRKRCIEKFRNL